MKKPLLFIVFITFIISSCTKDATKALQTIEVSFENLFGDENLKFNKRYQTLEGSELEITKFNYYISNIELEKTDGNSWKEEQSYRLLRVNDDENNHIIKFNINNVPEGTYHKIRFSVGVDPTMNFSGSQEGDLDPVLGMFWTWKTGYIFFKTEGFYYVNDSRDAGLIYHIGGDESYRTVELDLNNSNKIEIVADLQKLFGGFQGASITLDNSDDKNDIMGGSLAPKVAENYVQMFSIKNN